MLDLSMNDQQDLFKSASLGHSLSREGSEEARRNGRRRAARPALGPREMEEQKRKDEKVLLGKRDRKSRNILNL